MTFRSNLLYVLHMTGSKLKKYVIENNLVPHDQCAICANLWEWMGKKLVLHLDHIDGNRYNDALENLRFLCPNCHSQQETSNRRKPSPRITADEIKKVLADCTSKREILIKLGKSDASGNYQLVRKLMKQYGLQITKRKEYVYTPCLKTRRTLRPSHEELIELTKRFSLLELGRRFGVSGNAVKKWLVLYSKQS
jgi:hypothetical protein